MTLALITIVTILFAIQAVRAQRLIVAALWLAGASALLSLIFYLMGAYFVAVVELSVGAGLVTVLFVFAISIAGEETAALSSLLPKPLAIALAFLPLAILGWYALPVALGHLPAVEAPLPDVLWQQRSLDVFVQLALIFSGVLGLLGLLAEAKAPLKYPLADEFAAKRERELRALTPQGLEEESA
ncbi:MAG: NADH-quinone oxidoreductase subunit J [Anaerolineales bacterium]|nr:NADH-quinone oxidoreductase subunit J [Anaerolineales bacterium]